MGVLRQIEWMGDSLDQLRTFPEEVKDEIGFALTLAQQGLKHEETKPFNVVPKGMEIVSDFDGNTWRGIYTLHFKGWIYVLDCFAKKSTKGKKTPKPALNRIKLRFKAAEKLHKELNRPSEK